MPSLNCFANPEAFKQPNNSIPSYILAYYTLSTPTIMPEHNLLNPTNIVEGHHTRCPTWPFDADDEAPSTSSHKRTATDNPEATTHPPKKWIMNLMIQSPLRSDDADEILEHHEKAVHSMQEPEPVTEKFDQNDQHADELRDVKRKKDVDSLKQTSLDVHAVDRSSLQKVTHYSKDGFKWLCLEWGAATDQMAAAAPDADTIYLLNQVATRAGYIERAGKYILGLKKLFASDTVKGRGTTGAAGAPSKTPRTSKKSSKAKRLLSDAYDESQVLAPSSQTTTPTWEQHFDEYMTAKDELYEDQSIVTWWGESLEEDQAHEDDTMKGIGNVTSDWLLDADCFVDGDDVLDDTFK
ncbi:hypothetical protein EDD85DRAFT_940687 [Armillaria nabsnona]|nr:hypothetical protein EDD85DRAFT_940687 [Armillaria nabsnona]